MEHVEQSLVQQLGDEFLLGLEQRMEQWLEWVESWWIRHLGFCDTRTQAVTYPNKPAWIFFAWFCSKRQIKGSCAYTECHGGQWFFGSIIGGRTSDIVLTHSFEPINRCGKS